MTHLRLQAAHLGFALLTTSAAAAWASPAAAQNQDEAVTQTGPVAPPAVLPSTQQPVGSSAAAEKEAQTPSPIGSSPPSASGPDFTRFDALSEPGLSVVFPGTADTVLRDTGGFRTTLAEHGVSIIIRSDTILGYDVLQNNRPSSPQVYNGQKFTVQASGHYIAASISLDSLGLEHGKLLTSVVINRTTWQAGSPSFAGFRELAYYQSFFNRAVEIKAGYQVNYMEFIGLLTGGSPLLNSGLSSLVPVEVGLSVDSAAAPTFNLTLNGKNGTYFKGGIQRSTSPLGTLYDQKHNSIGLDFRARQASALYIGEVGIKRAASEDSSQLWLRAGAMYNTSNYNRFDNKGTDSNYSLFALGDYQVAKIDKTSPYRGVFIGASAFYAPPSVNVYSEYYEARAYAIGLFDARPADSIVLNVNLSKFSNDARRYLTLEPTATPSTQVQVSTSYSYHLMPGIYLSPSLSYVHNPSFTANYRDALVLGFSAYLQL